MQTTFRNSTCLTALVLLTIGGCGQSSFRAILPSIGYHSSTVVAAAEPTNLQYFVNPQVATGRPNRVVMVASGRSNGSYRTHQKVINELAAQIRARSLFEVVAPPDRYLQGHSDNILEGKFEETDIAAITREFNADTLLLIRVNEFRPAPPMRASLSIAILSGSESVVAFGLDGVWDLASLGTKNSFEQFLQGASWETRSEASLRLQSPNLFFRFIGSQVADSIIRSGF